MQSCTAVSKTTLRLLVGGAGGEKYGLRIVWGLGLVSVSFLVYCSFPEPSFRVEWPESHVTKRQWRRRGGKHPTYRCWPALWSQQGVAERLQRLNKPAYCYQVFGVYLNKTSAGRPDFSWGRTLRLPTDTQMSLNGLVRPWKSGSARALCSEGLHRGSP